MSKKLIRDLDDPELNESLKISSADHFELVYMRHRYFRQSTNPEPKRLAEFEEMICLISDKHYIKNIEVFKTVGFEMDDLRNIGRIHTISFISMGGLKENPDLMEKFIEDHKNKYGKNSDPSLNDIFLKECYNLSKFLNQRFQEVVRFSKNKNEKIRGTRNYRRFYKGDPQNNPSDSDLFKDPQQYGYTKISETQFKDLAKQNKVKKERRFMDKDGNMIRAVFIKGSFLTEEDIEDTYMDVKNTSFYRSPEDNLLIKESFYKGKKSLYKKL